VQRLTDAGLPIGTPAYMSPEQLEGSDVDARSDIFALGVLLYELASGRHPFQATTPASTAARVLMAAPPDLHGTPGVPRHLEAIIRRCLEKSKADRYAAASDVARELEALPSGRPSPAGSVRAPATSSGPGGPAGSVRAPTTSSGPGGTAVSAEARPIRWWVFHQALVMAVSAVMVWPVAMVHGAAGSDWTLAVLLAVIAAAAVNGTLRAHLLFLAAFSLRELRVQVERSAPWLQRSDRLFAALLLLSAVPTAREHPVRSAILAAVALGWTATSVVIEPATRRAAFPDEAA
jgi:hypothetical protein